MKCAANRDSLAIAGHLHHVDISLHGKRDVSLVGDIIAVVLCTGFDLVAQQVPLAITIRVGIDLHDASAGEQLASLAALPVTTRRHSYPLTTLAERYACAEFPLPIHAIDGGKLHKLGRGVNLAHGMVHVIPRSSVTTAISVTMAIVMAVVVAVISMVISPTIHLHAHAIR